MRARQLAREAAGSFRNRPLDAGPYTFVWLDALTQKAREGGRTVNVHCLIATGVNAAGYREMLGIDVTSSEDGAGWLAFLRGLAARGLSGVALVVSDDHAGLVNAITSVLPGAARARRGPPTITCAPCGQARAPRRRVRGAGAAHRPCHRLGLRHRRHPARPSPARHDRLDVPGQLAA
jgi:hypothetical protein